MSLGTINQRTQQVLKNLIERYIQDGCPIGSKTLAEECALGLSPATIRHILADLEETGYLASPHASAGRVPTALGYRFFVDSLLAAKPIDSSNLTLSYLLQSTSLLLSSQNDQLKLADLLQVAIKAFANSAEESKGYVMAGQTNLFSCTHLEANLEQLRLLFNAFNEKEAILNLLDSALEAEGIQIFIGEELGCEALDDCSIVASSYSMDGKLVGSLGVIGPTRMPYDKVISAVDITAKLLSAALSQS